ncbi:MAG: SDR family oxidoreductase [Bdellovibrionota bacterium]
MSVFKEDILKGKTALITGGGTGICKGIAETFARHGASLCITSRKQENLDKAAKEITAATGAKVLPLAADVRKPEEIEGVVKKAAETLGGIDVVINGAAGNFPVPVAQLSYNGFHTVVAIDLEGTFNVSKACFPHLTAAGKKHGNANIINITATLQYTGVPFQAHVSSAKAGIDALTRTLANEWGSLGVRVNGIAPGPIGGTEGMKRLAPGPDGEKRAAKAIPLGRFGKIQEIADAALFLISDASKYTTGQILIIDGGQWISRIPLGA